MPYTVTVSCFDDTHPSASVTVMPMVCTPMAAVYWNTFRLSVAVGS